RGHGQRLRGGTALSLELGPRPRPQLPAPVARDLDRDCLVAGRVERLEHGARRVERHLVLARTASHQDGDANPGHYCGRSRPTTIVTVVPGFAFVPPVGSCDSTMP